MNSDLDIYEYENLLLGRSERINKYFDDVPLKERRKIVGNIWNYAITHLLKLTPQEALIYLNEDIVKTMKLDKLLVYLDINPNKFYIGKDYKVILQYAFPKEIVYDFKEETIADYERIVKQGEWINDLTDFRFPKNFFIGEDGIKRAAIILNYINDKYLSDLNLREKYEFFANTKEATKWLTEKGLSSVFLQVYKTPLEYFHNSLPYNMQSYFYYYANLINYKYTCDIKKRKRKTSV